MNNFISPFWHVCYWKLSTGISFIGFYRQYYIRDPKVVWTLELEILVGGFYWFVDDSHLLLWSNLKRGSVRPFDEKGGMQNSDMYPMVWRIWKTLKLKEGTSTITSQRAQTLATMHCKVINPLTSVMRV